MSGDKPWEHRPVGTPPEWRALSLKEQIKWAREAGWSEYDIIEELNLELLPLL